MEDTGWRRNKKTGGWFNINDINNATKKTINEYMNDFIRQKSKNNNTDYMMAHRPTETGITADNLINQDVESPMPKDAYEHPEYYSVIGEKYTKETMQQLNKVRGNPNAEITIYRATTGDSFNYGDWITLSKSYAEHHNYLQLDSKGKVIEMKVKAKDIQFAGDDLAEWGYYPKKKK